MFRIIGIETIDPGDTLLNFLNAMPGIENNSRLWMEKFKKDRYDSVIRVLKNDEVWRTYVFHHEYCIHEHQAIRITDSDEDNPKSNILDTLRNGKDILILPNGKVTRRWHVDYIMPISQGNDNCIQHFSRTGFKTLIKIFLWLNNAGQFEDSHDFMIPIELKYKDINDKQYTKECDMLIRLSFIEGVPTKIVCQIKSGQPYKEEYEDFKEEVDEENIISVYKIN